MTYTDPTRPANERASDLLAQMTIAEKVAQLSGVLPQILGAPNDMTKDKLDARLAHGVGHICGAGAAAGDAVGIATFSNSIQRYLQDHTRLGIPAILHNEALNGVTAEGFTSFPTAIGLAGTWNPDNVHRMADLIRRQMTASGLRQALAPVLDIARDARWGRVHETYGEDVLLTSAFGVAYVQGLQGDDLRNGVIATAKHFLGYAMTEGGQNMAATHIGPRELYDVHAAPFEAAIRLANLQSVMNSYSEIDGMPVATSPEILTDLLRGRLGFDGTVVSDYRSLYYVVERQGVGTVDQVAEAGLRAGLDVELPAAYAYGSDLVTRLEKGEAHIADVDQSVHRTLTHKFALGLFENPYVDADPIVLTDLASDGRDLSRSITDEAVTMLKNEGVLPLSPEIGSVAVIGPHADSVMAGFGNYTHPPFLEMLKGLLSGKSRMAGMEQALSNPNPEAQAQMRAKMEELAKLDPERIARESYGAKSLFEALRQALPHATVTTATGTGVLDEEPSDIGAAVEKASGADVIVLAVGGRSVAFAGRATEGEGSDAATMELPSNQVALMEAVAALGKPVVAVVYMGKPYALAPVEHLAEAIITGYIPGPEGGASLAGVLTGEVVPSGKLPFTIPRHVGQTPLYHSQKRGSGQRRTDADQFKAYVDLENTPLYPFGYGLSYTSFAFSDLVLGPPTDSQSEFTVEATVQNTGNVAGAEVVQVYVTPPAYAITRPERQLAAFARTAIDPGRSVRLSFSIDMRQLGYTDENNAFVVDPGEYRVRVGSSSEELPLDGTFTIEGDRAPVSAPHSYLPRVGRFDL